MIMITSKGIHIQHMVYLEFEIIAKNKCLVILQVTIIQVGHYVRLAYFNIRQRTTIIYIYEVLFSYNGAYLFV